MSKIYVTGANGLVGSFICKRLIKEGYSVVAIIRKNSDISLLKGIKLDYIKGDVLDPHILVDLLTDKDILIHTAALVSFYPKEFEEMYKINVDGTRNLINIALDKKIKQFIQISSIAAIGKNKDTQDFDENVLWEESEENTHYALSKYYSELEVWRGVEEGLNAVIFNPSVILGPADWNRSSTALFKYVADENKYYSSGIINYVDVRDIAEAVYLAIEKNITAERFILSAGNTSYKNFMFDVADNFKKKRPAKLVTPILASVAWRVEAFRAMFSSKRPLITKETARSSRGTFTYNSTKSKELLGLKYHEYSDTLQWCCEELKAKYPN